MFQVPEKYRVRTGMMATDSRHGNNGAFRVQVVELDRPVFVNVIASDGEGWEHVSVSFRDRTPSWDIMCQIKEMFWGEEDCVVQYHPPKSEYVNCHVYCLHLWRPTGGEALPMPPSYMVGPL